MKKQEWNSYSAEETVRIGSEFAKSLKPGTVIALHGNLGAGKTTFIKGLALGFGLPKDYEVTSPTFALMHIYPAKIPLYHFDLYRLADPKEIADIGFEEFANDPRAVTCVEWAEKAEQLLPAGALHVYCEAPDENSRRFRVQAAK